MRDNPTVPPGSIVAIERLSRDLRAAAATMTQDEARFLVDAYYMMQEQRKRTDNQVRAFGESKEPHMVLDWLSTQSYTMEKQVKAALEKYVEAQPLYAWLNSVDGIGPVIAAGLMAHIDIKKAPTVGHIWSYGGYDPTKTWEKGCKRPWNAALKVLFFKIGESFVKVSGNEEAYYGQVYRARKLFESEQNALLKYAAQAAEILQKKKIGKDTDAYKAYSIGKLPPAHIHARAKRYAVKIFLAHMHHVWWELGTGTPPVKPYAITILGHGHYIPPPNYPVTTSQAA